MSNEKRELRTIIALEVYPGNLTEMELALHVRYPGWSHLLKPDYYQLEGTTTMEIALDPPRDEWTEQDEIWFANLTGVRSFQKLDAQAWLEKVGLAKKQDREKWHPSEGSQASVTIPETGSIIDVEEIDDLLDELPGEDHVRLIGCFLRWHNEETYPFEMLENGRLGARFQTHCVRCQKPGPLLYLTSGLHNGAWCYLSNKQGEYQANLRDQDYICNECQARVH